MKVQQSNPVDIKKKELRQQNDDSISSMSSKELEIAFAESLLDQVDAAQLQIKDIQRDIALLQTLENALCLISENMAKVRRLAEDIVRSHPSDREKNLASDTIRNLMMVNMLIAEDTEYDGNLLFKDGIIRIYSCQSGEVTLETEKIPEISGVEDADFQAILDSLVEASHAVNRQYKRINTIMLELLHSYQQLRLELDILRKAYP